MLEDLLQNEDSSIKKLFQLFEEYWLSLQNTNILLRDFYLKDFPKILKEFFLAKKTKIDKIFSENKKFFERFLYEFSLETFLISVVMVGLPFLRVSDNPRRFQNYPPTSAPFAMVSHPVHSYSSRNQTVQKDFLPAESVNSIVQLQPVLQVTKRAVSLRPLQIRNPIINLSRAQKLLPLSKVKQNCSDVKQKLQQTFPSSLSQIHVNVGYELNSETGALVCTDQVNLLNTSGTYGINDKVKSKFITIVKDTSLTMQPIDMDREHVTVSPFLSSYGIPRNAGGTYFILRDHHKAHTRMMNVTLPTDFGYGTEKSNAVDFHEYLAGIYDQTLVKLYDANPEPAYLLK